MRKTKEGLEECSVDDRTGLGWNPSQRGIPICSDDHERLTAEWEEQLEESRESAEPVHFVVGALIRKERNCVDWCELDVTATARGHKAMRKAEEYARDQFESINEQLAVMREQVRLMKWQVWTAIAMVAMAVATAIILSLD